MTDEAINDRAVERHDARVEIDNQVCTTCHGTGVRRGGQGDYGECPDCDGEGVAW